MDVPPMGRAVVDAVRAGPAALVLLLGALLQAPWLARPFGFFEFNFGYYFGPFAQSYARFGWANLRGIPLGAYDVVPAEPQQGFAYLNHPPGIPWMFAALGTSEWHLRLPAALGTIAAGLLTMLLLRPRLGPWYAAAAGVLLQTFPVLTFACQSSFESLVMPCGLALLWAFERATAGVRGARAMMVAAAAIGPWLDWSFAFFVLAMLPLAGPGTVRTMVRRLALPWLVALGSVAMVALWMLWARSAPFLRAVAHTESSAAMLDRVFGDWPPLGAFVTAIGDYLVDALTLPGLAAAGVGSVWWFRRDWRLAVAFLLPGVLHVAVFAKHAYTHLMFWCYLVLTAAAATASLLHALGRVWPSRAALVVAFAALATAPTMMTIRMRTMATAPVFAEIGAVLTRLAEEPRADAAGPTVVVTNAARFHHYYVRSSKVYLGPVTSVAMLEQARAGGSRLRFVYVTAEIENADHEIQTFESPELLAWLRQFPQQELPTLVGSWPFGKDGTAHIRSAWVFEL